MVYARGKMKAQAASGQDTTYLDTWEEAKAMSGEGFCWMVQQKSMCGLLVNNASLGHIKLSANMLKVYISANSMRQSHWNAVNKAFSGQTSSICDSLAIALAQISAIKAAFMV